MATSRAWTFTARGAPRSVLSLTPRPVPTLPPAAAVVSKSKDSSEWLLIKVAYAALNPGGHFFMSMIPAAARTKTAVPEMDLSGVVADVWTPSASSSAAKARFRKGDRVAALIPVSFGWATGTGALAEHVVLPAKYAVAAVFDREVAMENVVEGYDVVESGRARGKVVVKVGEE
ncbi:hypothetical protein K4K60_002082 [Colletotrichum sp. SAR11_57]|nr:hypothetical protein K4K60_002082 [Colletotrichum sp. SAR11_57]